MLYIAMSSKETGCQLSQNARGGLFFIFEDETLHSDLVELMAGETAALLWVGED